MIFHNIISLIHFEFTFSIYWSAINNCLYNCTTKLDSLVFLLLHDYVIGLLQKLSTTLKKFSLVFILTALKILKGQEELQWWLFMEFWKPNGFSGMEIMELIIFNSKIASVLTGFDYSFTGINSIGIRISTVTVRNECASPTSQLHTWRNW